MPPGAIAAHRNVPATIAPISMAFVIAHHVGPDGVIFFEVNATHTASIGANTNQPRLQFDKIAVIYFLFLLPFSAILF